MTSSVYSAGTPKRFQQLSEENGGLELIAHLTNDDLKKSASRWGLQHLLAFRLLTLPEKSFLEVIKDEHESCPLCYAEEPSSQEIDRHWAEIFTSTCPLDLMDSTDSQLLRLQGGFFWVALARAVRAEADLEQRDHPQRERRPVEREGYVNSMDAIVESSSPSGTSSSEFEPDNADVDEDEHDARRKKPEEVTVQLLICFLQFSLNLCLSQDPTVGYEIQPRVERKKCTAAVAEGHTITAEDDGGICFMTRKAQGWDMRNPSIALLEAKKAFGHMYFNKRSGQRKPVVSNATLAQYLGEALVSWRATGQSRVQDVFLIASTNTFVRFVHFRFGTHYKEYIDAPTEEAQKALVDNENKDTFVYMHSTKWFNLQTSEGRHVALCHILALLRWHDEHTTIFALNPDERSPPGEYGSPILSEDGDSFVSSEADDYPMTFGDGDSSMDDSSV